MANEYAERASQYNAAGTAFSVAIIQAPTPAGTVDGVRVYDSSTHTYNNYILGAGLSLAAGALALSPSLVELANMSVLAPNEAIRTDGSGNYVAETPSNFLTWLGGVHISGSYNDPAWITGLSWAKISGAPTIPAAQVQTDWSAVSGLGAILNKPTLSTVATTGAYSDLSGLPTLFNGTFTDLTAKPTTLLGYGITDAYPLSGNPSGFITSSALSGYATTSSVASGYYPLAGNPSSFLTSINSGMVIAALGMTPVNQSGARGSITLTTTGTSGNASYNSTSGVLNVPNYANSVGTVTSIGISSTTLTVSGSPITASGEITVNIPASSFNNAPGRALVTVAAAANGFQISSTRGAMVSYSQTIISTATIAGNASGYVLLEICPTNSAVAANWIAISRVANGQAVSLAVVLQSVSTGGGVVSGMVPASYYCRIRSVTTSGSPSYTTNEQQEVLVS